MLAGGKTTGTYLSKVSCMRRNLVGNDTLLNVIPVWQSQVLLGSHIAQQGSACTETSHRWVKTSTLGVHVQHTLVGMGRTAYSSAAHDHNTCRSWR